MAKKKYVVVRASSAGVFAGTLESRKAEVSGIGVVLSKVRRIWYWKGAASLSQLAMEGVRNPSDCKFSVPVDRQEINGVIEILDTTLAAKKNLEAVPCWKE